MPPILAVTASIKIVMGDGVDADGDGYASSAQAEWIAMMAMRRQPLTTEVRMADNNGGLVDDADPALDASAG